MDLLKLLEFFIPVFINGLMQFWLEIRSYTHPSHKEDENNFKNDKNLVKFRFLLYMLIYIHPAFAFKQKLMPGTIHSPIKGMKTM